MKHMRNVVRRMNVDEHAWAWWRRTLEFGSSFYVALTLPLRSSAGALQCSICGFVARQGAGLTRRINLKHQREPRLCRGLLLLTLRRLAFPATGVEPPFTSVGATTSTPRRAARYWTSHGDMALAGLVFFGNDLAVVRRSPGRRTFASIFELATEILLIGNVRCLAQVRTRVQLVERALPFQLIWPIAPQSRQPLCACSWSRSWTCRMC